MSLAAARRNVDPAGQLPLLATPPEALAPPLKWAGGKRWQLPFLREIWAPHQERRLVEPFCGGLAVALGLRPRRALVNDINAHLVNFYRWVREGLSIDLELRNEEALYYAHRERFNALLRAGEERSREAASLFYFLNRTGFNGLCRFNRSGFFNVPFGRYTSIPYQRTFERHQAVFEHWTLTNEPFEAVALRPDDFVYADPPYDVPFTQYSKGGFGWEDQRRAAEWLALHPGPVVLVNQATPRIEELYRSLGFSLSHLQAPRRISCTGDRAAVQEVVAVRNC